MTTATTAVTVVTRRRLAPFLAAALVVVAFIALSSFGAGPGLPLDDGWIHQTYARNLAQDGRWAFGASTASAGSTAPLWTLILALGYLLRLSPLLWTYLMGVLALMALIVTAMRLWRVLWPAYVQHDWLVGLALAFSWPLVWAAGSGMETLLFIALGLLLVVTFLEESAHAWLMGLIAGFLILARPDGLILVALVATALSLQKRWRPLALYSVAALLPLLPYFLFNVTASGVLWPNTFYAKQTEYASLLARPLPARFLQLLYFSLGGPEDGWRGLSGAQLLLAPGLFFAAWRALQSDWTRRRLWRTLPLLWAGGHVLAYALRLPVTYQHGRYLWAALPVWILFGLAGWADVLGLLRRRGRSGRLLAQVGAGAFAVLLLIFLFFGALAYAEDVAFVQNEMVDVALWLQENTQPGTLVAAHDIGAIGYFARRPILDLAGLISPQVIPLLQDQAALAQLVRRSDAGYLVTAPGWPYDRLTSAQDVRLVYDTGYAWTRGQGLNNMAVYALPGAAP
ncbi:MAG TPA: hypothetical protein VE553_01860 [Candidatus Binatia bacterium]|nr:hypothetical protein [Candidatus Binatia bacterium]